jgi:hypothetical protein
MPKGVVQGKWAALVKSLSTPQLLELEEAASQERNSRIVRGHQPDKARKLRKAWANALGKPKPQGNQRKKNTLSKER